LRVRAVDADACAWRRALDDVDAVLDFGAGRARLVMFGDPIGETKTLPFDVIETDDDLIDNVRNTLNVARLEDVADVRRLAIAGSTAGREELIERIAAECGVTVSIAAAAGTEPQAEPPGWLLAFGLCLWSYDDLERRAS
jgi:hypothetical protein